MFMNDQKPMIDGSSRQEKMKEKKRTTGVALVYGRVFYFGYGFYQSEIRSFKRRYL